MSMLKWNCSSSDFSVPQCMMQLLMLLSRSPTEQGKSVDIPSVDLNVLLHSSPSTVVQELSDDSEGSGDDESLHETILGYSSWKQLCQEEEEAHESEWSDEDDNTKDGAEKDAGAVLPDDKVAGGILYRCVHELCIEISS